MPYTNVFHIIDHAYPVCRSFISPDTWTRMIRKCGEMPDPETLQHMLEQTGVHGLPEFLPELARLEWTVRRILNSDLEIPGEISQMRVNPTIQLIRLTWKNLTFHLNSEEHTSHPAPEPGEELVLIWKDPDSGTLNIRPALKEELLILKIIEESIPPEMVAKEGNLPIGTINKAIDKAASDGILLTPKSQIRRDSALFFQNKNFDECFLLSETFNLQWHITQTCDLHCKHCYDRSIRSQTKLNQAIKILDSLYTFCQSKHVKGAVSFTGGNPLLYPHFIELYRAASERGFYITILGNPAPRRQIEELIAIQRPAYFQLSIEGLPALNDSIRGLGHFSRVIAFIKLLRELGIYSMVMLTLTRDNMEEVLPLAEMLRNLTDRFHFNRLSMVGEGANLQLPDQREYIAFLESYIRAAENNPIMGMKDNLINILHYKKGLKPFGGCTGYGCGAAFNFLSLLSDGEVHACRKFPSLIGNVFQDDLTEIYDSERAERYRSGCNACKACDIRPVCGGCLAIAYSHSLN